MLTYERLTEVLIYDPENGDFFWRVTLNNRRLQGQKAGCVSTTQRVHKCLIGVDGKMYQAHRLAWFYMTGKWPTKQIDHVDGNSLNNAIANLREATNAENHQNLKRARKDNTSSGLLGVSKNYAGHWRARIYVNGKEKHLGVFNTSQEAHRAYVEAKRQYHPFGEL